MRRLDHFNCLAVDVQANRQFFERYLGFRLTERIVLNDGTEAGMWLTCTNKSYDFAYTREAHGVRGRFHHLTYALDSRKDILRAADVFLENDVFIETGPHKHAVQQTFFLYVYEPGGKSHRGGQRWRRLLRHRTGSPSPGPRRSARRVRHGASKPSRASIPMARRRSRPVRKKEVGGKNGLQSKGTTS